MQQTALDLMAEGYDIHVVADGVSSCTMVERLFSLEVSMCVIIILHTKGTFNDIIICIITCYRILWKVLNHIVKQFC